MNIETNENSPKELDTQEIEEETTKELNNLKQDIDPEKINIEEEMKKIPVPEYYKQFYSEEGTEEELKEKYHKNYTEIVYTKHLKTYYNEGKESTYWEDDRSNIERFFTLEDKIQQMEDILNVKIDRKKLLMEMRLSTTLYEFFGQKRGRAHVHFPFTDKPEERSVRKNNEGEWKTRIIVAKTAKEMLEENYEYKEIVRYDGFPEKYTELKAK